MRVWVTRTDSSAAQSARHLREAGHSPILAPLLKLVASSVQHASPAEDCALAFTSQNGVRAFAALSDRRSWPVFTVGDATAELARQYGFADVRSASGNVEELAALILQSDAEKIAHLSGVHVAGDLVGALISKGRAATRTIIYATQAVSELPEPAAKALHLDAPLAVMFYSPKAAQVFRHLVAGRSLQNMTSISISSNVDGVLDGLDFASRKIAKTPSEPAMIAALEV